MAKDKGQEYTDSVISELEKKIQKEYKQANDEVQQKVDNYFARFAKKDQKKQTQLKAGYITQDEYNQWRYGQVCVGERWKELKQNLAEDYVNANQIARAMVADKQADVYALNHNFATYQVEHDSLMDTSYTLYNRRTVQNLVKDNPRLLPYLSKDSPTAKKLSERMDLIWNRQKINSAITQGVLQGESIPQISKRLEKVTDMNHSAAVRNARTMMTSCENKGRQDAYDSLRDKGIDLAEKWVATLDNRTRHSHRHLHGTYKDPKTGLYENGLEYPGDPFGEPEEIYNCRCCEVAEVLGFKIDTPTTSPKLGNMSFEEWQNARESGGLGATLNLDLDLMPSKDRSYIYKVMDKYGNFDSAEEYWRSYANGKMKDSELKRELDSRFAGGVTDKVPVKSTVKVSKSAKASNISKTQNSVYSFSDKDITKIQKKIDGVSVAKNDKKLSTSEIVKKISGGDKTGGSCVSLSLAYVGNEAGYDVRDFRGGDSRTYFSRPSNLLGMLENANIPIIEKKGNSLSTAISVLGEVKDGKEYMLITGKHATIVKKTGNYFYYLEMQSGKSFENGFVDFGSYGDDLMKYKLGNRFKSKDTSDDLLKGSSYLVDIEPLKKANGFEKILSFINTNVGEELKGAGGRKK